MVSAEYLFNGKHGCLTVDLRGEKTPALQIDWFDWSDDFLAPETFRRLVLSVMDGNWPLGVFGRRRTDGNIDVLDVESGERATTLDRDGVYPVGSDLGAKYEHAAGIVLTPDQCEELGIEIE